MDISDEAKAHQGQVLDAMRKISEISTMNTQTRLKVVTLFALHLQNFQKAIIVNRRRHQQRLHRRRTLLRQFYHQHVMEMSTHMHEALLSAGMAAMPAQSKTEEDSNSKANNTEQSAMPHIPSPVDPEPKIKFFENILGGYSDEQWLTSLRMSRTTFQKLFSHLRGSIGMCMKSSQVPPEKCMAIALYALATGAEFRAMAMLFDVEYFVVRKCLLVFVEVLLAMLGANLIAMPKSTEEYNDIRQALRGVSNMPAAIVGVMGVLELPGSTIRTDGQEKILQAMIDDRMLFRSVQVDVKRYLLFMEPSNPIAKLDPQLINERYVPSFVLATPQNYSLRPWIMQAYNEPVSPHEYDFNDAAESLMLIKDNAFRRLLTRWQILRKRWTLNPQRMEKIIVACCALHNLLEETGEKYNPNWATINLDQYETKKSYCMTNSLPTANILLEMRDFLARTISSTEM